MLLVALVALANSCQLAESIIHKSFYWSPMHISVDPTDPNASFEYAGDRKHMRDEEIWDQKEKTPPADSVELSAGVCMRVPFSRVLIKTPIERKRTSSNVDFAGVSPDILYSTVGKTPGLPCLKLYSCSHHSFILRNREV